MSKRIGSVIVLFLIGRSGGCNPSAGRSPGAGCDPAFEFFESGLEPVDALEARDHAAPGGGLLQRYTAGVYAGLGNRMAHHGGVEKHHVVADREMATDGDLARDHAALSDGRASRDARQSR